MILRCFSSLLQKKNYLFSELLDIAIFLSLIQQFVIFESFPLSFTLKSTNGIQKHTVNIRATRKKCYLANAKKVSSNIIFSYFLSALCTLDFIWKCFLQWNIQFLFMWKVHIMIMTLSYSWNVRYHQKCIDLNNFIQINSETVTEAVSTLIELEVWYLWL